MSTGPIHRLFLIVIAALLLPLHSYALDLDIAPDVVIPGDVFALRLKNSGLSAAGTEVEFNGNKIDLYTAGDDLIALVPVTLDTAPGEYTIVVRHNGEERTAVVEVKDHKFKTIKLTLPEGKVTLSSADTRRVGKEYLLQQEIWKIDNQKIWDGEFVFPTDTKVTEKFGVKRIMNKKKTSIHKGIDVKGKSGTPVRAINSGKVVLQEDLFYGGHTLVIDHGMGLLSVYMHLSKFNVKDGDKVSKRDVIGFVGMTGRATGPHLHMSVKLKGISVNPESLFRLEL